MTGEALLAGAVRVKVSTVQSPIAPPSIEMIVVEHGTFQLKEMKTHIICRIVKHVLLLSFMDCLYCFDIF